MALGAHEGATHDELAACAANADCASGMLSAVMASRKQLSLLAEHLDSFGESAEAFGASASAALAGDEMAVPLVSVDVEVVSAWGNALARRNIGGINELMASGWCMEARVRASHNSNLELEVPAWVLAGKTDVSWEVACKALLLPVQETLDNGMLRPVQETLDNAMDWVGTQVGTAQASLDTVLAWLQAQMDVVRSVRLTP